MPEQISRELLQETAQKRAIVLAAEALSSQKTLEKNMGNPYSVCKSRKKTEIPHGFCTS
jgi:hypothetical protein